MEKEKDDKPSCKYAFGEDLPMACIDCNYRETIYTNINSGYIECEKLGKVNYGFNIMDALKHYKPSTY